MANYRIGDIVRLTRKSVGMSQEELAFQAGLTTETISRIESGKHKVTQSTFKKVMEPLNRFNNRSYALCSGKDIGIYEEKEALEEAELKYDYEMVAKYIADLKEKVDDTIENRQYIMRVESWCEYFLNNKDSQIFLSRLEEALSLTIEDYHRYLDYKKNLGNVYPFTYQEIIILLNIAGAYNLCGNPDKAEQIFTMILDCLESGYMVADNTSNLILATKRNLTIVYERQGRYEEAIKLLSCILQEAKNIGYGLIVPIALYDISWNMEKINEVNNTDKYSLQEIRKKKRQAYYIAAARNDKHVMYIINRSYKRLFGEDID